MVHSIFATFCPQALSMDFFSAKALLLRGDMYQLYTQEPLLKGKAQYS
jgi:hypothetical protein